MEDLEDQFTKENNFIILSFHYSEMANHKIVLYYSAEFSYKHPLQG